MNQSQGGILRQAGMFVAVTLALTAATFADLAKVKVPDRDDSAIEYAAQATDDPVSKLNREIEAGEAHLTFDGDPGYLRSLLGILKIPIESQMMVFSKTSVPAAGINPHHPRVLFFNDSVVIGWVPGVSIEVAAEDSRQGVMFYTLKQTPTEKPQLERHDECLGCHQSDESLGIPGMLAQSWFVAPSGIPIRDLGSHLTDDRTPLEQRWGGWYVTGITGAIRHMGNTVVAAAGNSASPVFDQNLNLKSLAGKFDADTYLSPYSDIVALMVFEHQMHMANLITRVGWQTRAALYHHDFDPKALADSVQELVDYMLFVDEAPLANRIEGTSGFAEKFSAGGPKDKLGHSLRQLDLEHRLMKYPCSYMIYSEAFDHLPAEAKDLIYRRIWQILVGEIKGGKYARLSLTDRQAVAGILHETKTGLPDYFRSVTR